MSRKVGESCSKSGQAHEARGHSYVTIMKQNSSLKSQIQDSKEEFQISCQPGTPDVILTCPV